jgi:polar amino acid transport system permease protein
MNLDWSVLWGDNGLLILQGLVVTLELSAWTLALAFAIGLVVGVTRWADLAVTNPLCWIYVEVARNTPPVVQILFWYFSASYLLPKGLFLALRDVGYEFSAAIVALALYHGAFVAEVVRAGLNAVPRGQLDAARALGLGVASALGRVVMPQALRIIAPALVNEAVSIVKNTSLAMAIGVAELTYQYKSIDIFAFRGTEALVAVTVIYVALCLVIAGGGRLVSRRLSRHVRTASGGTTSVGVARGLAALTASE